MKIVSYPTELGSELTSFSLDLYISWCFGYSEGFVILRHNNNWFLFNPLQPGVAFLYPLKGGFSGGIEGIFREYRKATPGFNGLILYTQDHVYQQKIANKEKFGSRVAWILIPKRKLQKLELDPQ